MLVVFPLATAAVLITAGLSKVSHPDDLSRAAHDFRLPSISESPLAARAFIGAELILGVALLLVPSSFYLLSACVAVALFLGFAVLAVTAFARGDTFDCGCFGASSSAPVGAGMIARNLAFLALAMGAVAFGIWGAGSVPHALVSLQNGDAAWLAFIAAAVLVVFGVDRLSREDAQRGGNSGSTSAIGSDAGGMPIADFQVVDAEGHVRTMRTLTSRTPQLLLFIRPGCRSCESLLEVVPDITIAVAPIADVLLAVDASQDAFDREHAALRDQAVFAVRHAMTLLGVDHTPSAVLLGLNGTIQAGPAAGKAAINELLESMSGTYTARGQRLH